MRLLLKAIIDRMLKQGYEKNTKNAIIHHLKNFSFQHMHLLPVKCVYRAMAVFLNLQKNNAPTKKNSGKYTHLILLHYWSIQIYEIFKHNPASV